jgi:tyrosyl-tRNA synthetase
VDDKDLPKLFRFFSLLGKEEIELLENDFGQDPNTLKAVLAEEMTTRIHSEKAFLAAEKVSNILFNPKASKDQLLSLEQNDLELICNEIPSFKLDRNIVGSGLSVIDLLSDKTNIANSKSEARRAIESNAISLNKDKITDVGSLFNAKDLLHGRYVMVENGKKNKFLIEFT